ncbi:hypothetical protein CEXT_621451 [Caerostris extrusa]|uniref:Uncharacterized protein n=1 Tax=Caerostris extrusa TaxID=172846 RepID=A0AAV4NPW7_CAEEX|nr:hypothetical protein CEXT_621451 [Caerostris extrusa]
MKLFPISVRNYFSFPIFEYLSLIIESGDLTKTEFSVLKLSYSNEIGNEPAVRAVLFAPFLPLLSMAIKRALPTKCPDLTPPRFYRSIYVKFMIKEERKGKEQHSAFFSKHEPLRKVSPK